jgi:Baseplate J-like protein
MADILPTDERPVVDYTARDYASLLAFMRGLVPGKLPAWRDVTGEADFGNALLELFAQMGDILSYYTDRVANESFLSTARSRRSVIEHLRLIGYQLRTAAPATALLTVSVKASVTDVVTVNRGDAFATRSRKDAPSVRFEFAEASPLVINFGSITPVNGVKVFGDPLLRTGIPVVQGRLFTDEVLGRSDGSANQRFVITHPQVIVRPSGPSGQMGQDVAVLTRDPGGNVQAWTVQRTLAFSGGQDPHVVLEIDENDQATVVFGDGVFGARPAAGAVVTATYRTGGGQFGNVAPGAISTIVNAPPLALLAATVSNPAAAAEGADRESIEQAVRFAPAVFRAQGRAVTAGDYEALALTVPGVGKVRAASAGWNQIVLLVAPSGGGHVSDALELQLKSFFEDKRMLSQVIEVAESTPVEIRVTAQVTVQSYYVPQEVLDGVRTAIGMLLAFDAVDFGQQVYLSAFYEAAGRVPGVNSVNVTEFRRGDEPGVSVEPDGRITLKPNELPVVPADPAYAGGLNVLLSTGEV